MFVVSVYVDADRTKSPSSTFAGERADEGDMIPVGQGLFPEKIDRPGDIGSHELVGVNERDLLTISLVDGLDRR